ncbi:hypothetical protein ACLKMH_14815 [Psychromonas sp. KJ10-10]|uniref:hypothetical protein n=1 Tax=Psychromonas sp. KJ10-10 TaxID=3391823 RepID=UPI0039B6DA29
MKIVKFTFISLVSLLFILLLTVSLVFFTHTGSQSLLSLAKQFETRLNIELVEGSLFNSPRYEQVAWRDGETSIEIESLSYQFDWLCLFNNLCLDSLNVDGAVIQLPATSEQVEEEPVVSEGPIEIDLPIDIHIDDINLSRIKFIMGEMEVDLNEFSLQAFVAGNNLSLSSKINGLLVTLPASVEESNNGVSTTTNNQKKKMDLSIASIPSLITPEMLPTVKLPLNINLESFVLERFKLVQNTDTLFELNAFQTSLSFKQTKLAISKLELDIPETQLNLDGEINFIDDYPLSLNIVGQVKNVKQLQPQDLLSQLNYKLSSKGVYLI